MSYSAQAALSIDGDFTNRVAACAATQEIGDSHPFTWASHNQWAIAAAPGFADKYAYALEVGVERPGDDPAVIPDADILAAVQALLAEPSPNT